MPPIEPEAATTIVPNSDRMLKIKPSALAQPLPWRKPQPVNSQIIPKKITTPPMMFPMLASRPPTPKPKPANMDESVAIAMPPINPTTPVSIASIAIIVTPIGLGDFCMKAVDTPPAINRNVTKERRRGLTLSRPKMKEERTGPARSIAVMG